MKTAQEELSQALSAVADKTARDDRTDPLNGFGRGSKRGEEALLLMPKWFQEWQKMYRWHPVGLLHGETAWWHYVEAFGLTRQQWWKIVEPFIKQHETKTQ